jgi:hypothetical protein
MKQELYAELKKEKWLMEYYTIKNDRKGFEKAKRNWIKIGEMINND